MLNVRQWLADVYWNVGLVSDEAGGHHGPVDRHVAAAGRLRRRAGPVHRGRHRRVGVRVPVAARRPPLVPTPQRLRRRIADQRRDEGSVGQAQGTSCGSRRRHRTDVQVPRNVGLRAVAASLETVSGQGRRQVK